MTVADVTPEKIEAAILTEAATWEVDFPTGPGQVVSVSDAARVAARALSADTAPTPNRWTAARRGHNVIAIDPSGAECGGFSDTFTVEQIRWWAESNAAILAFREREGVEVADARTAP